MVLPRRLRRICAWGSAGLRRLGGWYRSMVTTGRWFVAAFWLLAATLVPVLVPSHGGGGGGFGDLLPPDSAVLKVEQEILTKFRVPVLTGTSVVVHQPGGLSVLTRADSTLWALATTQEVLRSPTPPIPGQIVAGIPIPTGRADTTVTYLFMSDGTGLHNTVRLANAYAAHFNNQAEVNTYVTGFVPAQVAQGNYLTSRLGLFEIASVLLILLVVAVSFRSLLAPIMVLGIAAIGYLVYFPLLSSLADRFGFQVPDQFEPVLLALLLGVVTDYCVLFLSAFRDELAAGLSSDEAVRRTLRRDAPVVAVAGLTVAGGTIALLAAPFEIFRALGPSLALTVLVGVAVCLTLTPALMRILGWRLFTVLPVHGSKTKASGQLEADLKPGRLLLALTRRGPAFGATAAVVVLLALFASPVLQAKLDLSFTAGLPREDGVSQGAKLLTEAGLRGITAPTEVLIEGENVTDRRIELAALQFLLGREPGVARVLGPASLPSTKPRGLVLSTSGDAARYLVIYNSDPLAAEAIANVGQLQRDLPGLVQKTGLGDTRVATTGQTLIAAEVSALTRESLKITLIVAVLVELLILVLYLRALVAPLVLLACSVLSVAAALGLTTLVFQTFLGDEGLTFYAPFAAAVLLIALGSDYNVFAVGSIWEETRYKTLSEALKAAVPRTSRAITTAGVILAATFALVAIIPLSTFRQIAFAMTVGLLLDTLVVRPILTPAVLTLLGRTASWPSRRIRVGPPTPEHRG